MPILYVSSYAKHDDKGIYIIDFCLETKTLRKIQQIVTLDYPSYMICKDNTLYVSYKNSKRNNEGGGIGSFAIYKDELIPYSTYSSSGRSYTHLCVNENDEFLFAANYHVGATASYQIVDKQVVYKIGAVHHRGLGPDLLKRQTGPHVHCVGITPDKKYVYAVDLGADKIALYNYEHGILEAASKHSVDVVPGSGPRHMIFSKSGEFAYLVNEIANNIMVYRYLNEHFTLLQVITCLPHDFDGFSSAAAIKLSSSGNHLFVSNRGHDSIALYRVNKENGKVALLQICNTKKCPRDFTIVDDQFIVVACQDSDELQVFEFNESLEELQAIDSTLSIPQPVCITK